MTGISFKKLELEGWRQFDDIDLTFHPRLTVITGANGSGKSTILSIINRHFGYQRNYLATPVKDQSGVTRFASGILRSLWHRIRVVPNQIQDPQIGTIQYSSGTAARISLPTSNSVQYDIIVAGQQAVDGVFIDSYRPPPNYSPVQTIPVQPMQPNVAYNNYQSEVLTRYQGGFTNNIHPIFRMKEAMISMAAFGEGNSSVGSDPKIYKAFLGFTDVLKKLLPESLGFERISIRLPDVVFVTTSGEFLLDAVSGGVMTLLDTAWRIYLYSLDRPSFVVTMDEPENHLHPAMQRSLMTRMMSAFPNVQFIIATHSPFIVSSVKESNVYVLQYEKNGEHNTASLREANFSHDTAQRRVKSAMLDTVNKAASANEILRDVLGVPITLPEWVESDLENITRAFSGRPINRELIADLRSQLSRVGFSDYYPDALAALTRQ